MYKNFTIHWIGRESLRLRDLAPASKGLYRKATSARASLFFRSPLRMQDNGGGEASTAWQAMTGKAQKARAKKVLPVPSNRIASLVCDFAS